MMTREEVERRLSTAWGEYDHYEARVDTILAMLAEAKAEGRVETLEEARVFTTKLTPLVEAALAVERFSPFDPNVGLPRGFIAAVNLLNDATSELVRYRTMASLTALAAAPEVKE